MELKLINNLRKKLFRRGGFPLFVVIGMLNTIFSYALTALLLFSGLHFTLAILFSTIIGIIFNFNTTGKIVFENRDKSLFLSFTLVYIFLYLINISIVKLAHYYIENIYLDTALAVIICAILSFFALKHVIFKYNKS